MVDGPTATLVDRALELWASPVPHGDAGLAAFRTVYADPLSFNGQPTPLQVLVGRITGVWAIADQLGLLIQLGALSPEAVAPAG